MGGAGSLLQAWGTTSEQISPRQPMPEQVVNAPCRKLQCIASPCKARAPSWTASLGEGGRGVGDKSFLVGLGPVLELFPLPPSGRDPTGERGKPEEKGAAVTAPAWFVLPGRKQRA